MKSSITIKDVARHAGVSISTVSRVLNANSRVDAQIAQRVREAISALRYVPSASARNLKADKKKSIGLLVPQVGDTFFAEMLESVIGTAAAAGIDVSIFSCNGRAANEEKCLRAAVASGISALLYCPSASVSPEMLFRIFPRDFPIVIVYRRDMVPGLPHIYHDNVRGGEDAAKYLVMLERRKIAFFASFWEGVESSRDVMELYNNTALRGAYTTLDRLDGYRRVLENSGLVFDPELIVPCGFTYRSGYVSAKRLLATLKEFDAIICCKDEVAAGALQAFSEQKISVPERVSIVGFDDSMYAVVARPTLSTIRQFPGRLGEGAVKMAIDLMSGQKVSDVVIGMELVVRSSTSVSERTAPNPFSRTK